MGNEVVDQRKRSTTRLSPTPRRRLLNSLTERLDGSGARVSAIIALHAADGFGVTERRRGCCDGAAHVIEVIGASRRAGGRSGVVWGEVFI